MLLKGRNGFRLFQKFELKNPSFFNTKPTRVDKSDNNNANNSNNTSNNIHSMPLHEPISATSPEVYGTWERYDYMRIARNLIWETRCHLNSRRWSNEYLRSGYLKMQSVITVMRITCSKSYTREFTHIFQRLRMRENYLFLSFSILFREWNISVSHTQALIKICILTKFNKKVFWQNWMKIRNLMKSLCRCEIN